MIRILRFPKVIEEEVAKIGAIDDGILIAIGITKQVEDGIQTVGGVKIKDQEG
jgi:hypothetical protein